MTPAPWFASPHGDGWHITAHTLSKGETIYQRVATAHGMKGDDAKLIAAAPEMAETLRAIATELGWLAGAMEGNFKKGVAQYGSLVGERKSIAGLSANLAAKARQALAKAAL